MPLLEVNNLICSSGDSSRNKRLLLKNITFSIDEGSTLGLLGESGSGKTTIARCIAGLHTPDSGTITFNGKNIFPEKGNRKKIGRDIQLLFQNHTASLDPRMTIGSSIMESFGKIDESERGKMLGNLLAILQLPGSILGRLPSELSGGQRQRIALARAFCAAPRLCILDEPTSSLDAATQVVILNMIKTLQRETNVALLYISHDLATTISMSDAIGVLHNGEIVELNSPSEILRSPQHPYTKETIQSSFL